MDNLRKVYRIYYPFRFQMLGVFAFIGVMQGLALMGPLLQGRTIDVIAKHQSIRSAFVLAGLSFGIMFLRGVVIMYWREKYENKYLDFQIPRHVNYVTLESMLGFSLGQHISENSGLKQSVVNRGKNALTTIAPTILFSIFPTVSVVVIMIVALMYWSPPIGLAVLTGAGLFTIAAIRTSNKMGTDLDKLEKRFNENAKFQDEVVRNADLVITNAQEKRTLEECDENLAKVQEFQMSIWEKYLNIAVERNIIIGLTRLAVSVLGIIYVYQGRYSIGTLVVFWSWSSNALGEISMVGNLHRSFMRDYASIKKYFTMLDMKSDVPVVANPILLEPFKGDIEFRNVTLSYKRRDLKLDEDEEEETSEPKSSDQKQISPALENVSFTIPAGKRVAIVGESGAGKSTLVYALMRGQDPDDGQILIDGQDLRLLDLESYRRNIGYVPQQVPMFDRTIGYNITFGLEKEVEVTEEMMDRAAKMSCVDRFFNRLEKGYETLIGEKGIKLSGGERQRVGIARALIKNPKVLIFDEATSNLDSENESMIRESIEAASAGRTTIIIAHRFSTIRNVDKILVFDKSRLVGEGTHEHLLATCSKYQALLRHQTVGAAIIIH